MIRRLDLGNNKITDIGEEAFAGLEDHLKELVMHVQSLEEFPVEALGQLLNLEKLYLEGFDLEVLPDGALSAFVHLQVLAME